MLRPLALFQSVLFLGCLCAPVALTLLGVPSGRLAVEKRPLAPAPALSALWRDPAGFGPALAAHARDAAPFRDHLIRAGFRLRLALLGQSPAPSVLWGREGWLYFTQESALDDALNAIPLDAGDIATMVRTQVERQNWLAAQGIAYLVVVAPNKATVYPEFLPAGLRPLGPRSRLDQVLPALRQAGVAVLDLRQTLAQAKTEHRAYLKTDTHWNRFGAYRAASAVVASLREKLPGLAPLTDAACVIEEKEQPGGDLAEMLLMPDVLTEVDIVPRLLDARAREAAPGAYADPAGQPGRDRIARETDRPDGPRAIFFHDSFTRPMVPYLAEGFSRSVFLWSHAFSPEIIRAERPDVVVLEVVERYIFALTLKNPPEVTADTP